MKIDKLIKENIMDLWKGEATDYPSWLAMDENIAQLDEAVGIELKVKEEERNVGPFRADKLCYNTIDDRFVLVRNQLERKGHTLIGDYFNLCRRAGWPNGNLDFQTVSRGAPGVIIIAIEN